MPANRKHLSKSPWQQFAKIFTGIIGGYSITALFHMNLALWLPNSKEVLITSIFTFFIVWTALLIAPYLFKNGWKIMAIYIIIAILFYFSYTIGMQQNPFI